jgi:hypothetical protein
LKEPLKYYVIIKKGGWVQKMAIFAYYQYRKGGYWVGQKKYKNLLTVFPHIVSAETILFLNFEIVANSKKCHNISNFFLIN